MKAPARQQWATLSPSIKALNWALGAWLATSMLLALCLMLSGTALAQDGQVMRTGGEAVDASDGSRTQVIDINDNRGVVDRRPVGRETGLPIPRFVSLRNDKTNMRVGPGIEFEIRAIYNRVGLPVQVVAESGHWREVQDWEGTRGWVHKDLLSSRRTARVAGDWTSVLRHPDAQARPVAELAPGVLTDLRSCQGEWCVVEVEALSGWLPRAMVFGAFTHEDFS